MNPGTKTPRHSRKPRCFLTGLRSIGADKRAVTAIEFAMILPFMLILLIGMEEVTGTLDHDRKVSRIANSVADLVAQGQTVTPADLKAMLDIGGKIIDPYPDTNLETIVATSGNCSCTEFVNCSGSGEPQVCADVFRHVHHIFFQGFLDRPERLLLPAPAADRHCQMPGLLRKQA